MPPNPYVRLIVIGCPRCVVDMAGFGGKADVDGDSSQGGFDIEAATSSRGLPWYGNGQVPTFNRVTWISLPFKFQAFGPSLVSGAGSGG